MFHPSVEAYTGDSLARARYVEQGYLAFSEFVTAEGLQTLIDETNG